VAGDVVILLDPPVDVDGEAAVAPDPPIDMDSDMVVVLDPPLLASQDLSSITTNTPTTMTTAIFFHPPLKAGSADNGIETFGWRLGEDGMVKLTAGREIERFALTTWMSSSMRLIKSGEAANALHCCSSSSQTVHRLQAFPKSTRQFRPVLAT
jgi:hypothetical protein